TRWPPSWPPPSPTSSACTTSATNCAGGCTCSRRCSTAATGSWARPSAPPTSAPSRSSSTACWTCGPTTPTPSTACSASTCRSPAPFPRSRPGCTASTPSRALEVILRPHLGRVEKACRYCLGERTSQVHLLPEADERPAQAGRSLYQDRRTARASGPFVVLRAGGPTQIHLCWPAPPSHERSEPDDASRVWRRQVL